MLAFYEGKRSVALSESPDIMLGGSPDVISHSTSKGAAIRIGYANPPHTYRPSMRLSIQSATHDDVKTIDDFNTLLKIANAVDIETQEHEVPLVGTELEDSDVDHKVVFSSRMGFSSKEDRDDAVVPLKQLFPGKHVFARNAAVNVTFISLDIVTKVVPLLLLSATNPILPQPSSPSQPQPQPQPQPSPNIDVPTITAWLCYWVT